MISLEKIRKRIYESKNPLIFFDDDPDGLCSYLLIKEYFKKGKGIIVKSSPALDEVYLRKVNEIKPDLIIVLDKPIIHQDFVDKINVPLIWIDHHPIRNIKGVHYFNPRFKDPEDNRPTSYWCYKLTKKHSWIALVGIVSDWSLASVSEFKENYHELLPEKFKNPEDVLFNSELGKLIRIFSFVLKGKISEVRKAISVIEKIENPIEILEKTTPKGKYLYKKYERVEKTYDELIKDSKKIKGNPLVYTYFNKQYSFTSDLSNELLYLNPKKIIIVGRYNDDVIRLSVRSSKIKLPDLLNNAMKDLDGYSGGHDLACGGSINKKDFPTFISRLKKMLK
ncbi:hypothetical protein K8R47_03685 [archaeon]|nr:hypothetical protein [archaeon]